MGRNSIQRPDGEYINAGHKRGMLVVCATGCCCGITERGFAPVPAELYHHEWARRKLRNRVHLSMGGCLGPCQLANVAMLVVDGASYWFHTINSEELVVQLYDYVEALLSVGGHAPPPAALAPLIFNGFTWGHAGVTDTAHGSDTFSIALD